MSMYPFSFVRKVQGSTSLLILAMIVFMPLLRAQGIEKTTEAWLERTHVERSELLVTQSMDLGRTLTRLGDTLQDLESRRSAGKLAVNEDKQVLGEYQAQLAAYQATLLEEFEETRVTLAEKGVWPLYSERFEEAHNHFTQRMKSLMDRLDTIQLGQGNAKHSAMASLMEDLRDAKFDRSHQALDVDKLPFRAEQPETPAPLLDNALLHSRLTGDDTERDKAQILAHSKRPPVPEDLAENIDVVFTDTLREQVTALNGDPVALFQWVRNNIYYKPTHGSVQGSQLTLESLEGNAYDIASLLIAMLRSADIPARYAYGTVQVPVGQAMNWVNATSPTMAQELLGAGGIPTVGLYTGGTLSHLRFEHVWVEAYVDFVPSRGSRQGPGDTWVPMDAAFKQVERTPGIDFNQQIGFDFTGMRQQLFDGAQEDAQTGSVSNLGYGTMLPFLDAASTRSGEIFTDNGLPSQPKRGEVYGGQVVRAEVSEFLSVGLPYDVQARAGSVSTLPSSLRHYVQVSGYNSTFGRAFGSPDYTVRLPIPTLNSQQLGLSFFPENNDDILLQLAYDGGDATQLPLYLFRVIPTITVGDEDVVASGNAVAMGSEHFLDIRLEGPGYGETVSYQVVAGDEAAIGVNIHGYAQNVPRNRVESNPADTSGESLHQVALYYWMQCDLYNDVLTRNSDMRLVRRPSVGLFSSPMTVSYFFGFPRTGYYQSLNMDVKRSVVTVVGGDIEARRDLVYASGIIGSYLEGSTWDALQGDPIGNGVSAVQLLLDAARDNNPIYTITSANIGQALSQLNVGSAVRTDIQNAVASGKTVIVPENGVNYDGWVGTGYIVLDTDTGAAAYLISGGLNGGGVVRCILTLVAALVLIIAFLVALWYLAGLLAGLALGGGLVAGGALATVLLVGFFGFFFTGGGGGGQTAKAAPCEPCPPCPVPVGTLGYRHDKVPPSKPHAPCPGDHLNMYICQQNPNNCQCFWKRIKAPICMEQGGDPAVYAPGAVPIFTK